MLPTEDSIIFYSTIDGFIPSNLWGTENKRKLPCGGTQKNMKEQKCTPQINVCITVCVWVGGSPWLDSYISHSYTTSPCSS